MKIQVEVEIFDDPEYCHTDLRECPKYLDDHTGDYCLAFSDNKGLLILEYDCEVRLHKKCPQCKEAYQKTKKDLMDETFDIPIGDSKKSLFTDSQGKPYLSPMHPERG